MIQGEPFRKAKENRQELLPRFPAAVIFDMDGLLFDSEALYQRAITAAAREGGHDLSVAGPLMIGRPVVQSSVILREHLGPAFPVDAFFEAMFRHFDRMAATDLALKPGVLELLDTLDQLQLPRAIATSSGHPRVQGHLDLHQLGGRFHAIVGHGDCAASKPAPDAFLLAAQRLGVEPRRCLALEDSPNGVRAAHAAGMMTVMVPDLIAPTEEIRGLCAFVAGGLEEVRASILRAR